MDLRKVLQHLLDGFPYEPTAGQRELLEQLAAFLTISWKQPHAHFILSGYAGTGKTTVVKALVEVLPSLGKRTALLAPTGRAAKVLSSYTGRPANTIHRKIYLARTNKDGLIDLKMQTNYHKHTLFIVDEASMIPSRTSAEGVLFAGRSLLDDLFEFVFSGENCRLLFIGDSAQLPPVGLDYSPALDAEYLKRTYRLDLEGFELTEVVRQAKQSGILMNATALRRQVPAETLEFPVFRLEGFADVERVKGGELEELLLQSYSGREKDNTVVICRSNKRANLYNREIRRRILYYEEELSAGDYLMVVKNNYYWLPEESVAGFIANGDIVELVRIRKIEELYGFRFADVTIRFIDYPDEKTLDVKILLDTLMSESAALSQSENNRLFQTVMEDYPSIRSRRGKIEAVKTNPYFNALQVKYAYALTCHKTQGGQWEKVFVDQGYLNEKMMTRDFTRWLYTAVTRATKKLYLVSFEDRFFG